METMRKHDQEPGIPGIPGNPGIPTIPSIAEHRVGGVLLGCVADDFTGASDLANNLMRTGWPTLLCFGLPADSDGAQQVPPSGAPQSQDTAVSGLSDAEAALLAQAQAVVVALKSRTIAPDAAVSQSLTAWRWLQSRGAQQCYFKICSTFDSTDRGNIGPVADALLDALDAPFAVVCPAFPAGGRTVFRGHLFVGDQLLSDSGMKDHPLTPMTDSNLVRVLQRQSRHRIGLIDYRALAQGVTALSRRMAELVGQSVRMAIADATSDADLEILGEACRGLRLVVAGSGLALGIRAPGDPAARAPAFIPQVPGPALILSGSCSTATQAQVRHFMAQAKESGDLVVPIDVMELAASDRAHAQFLEALENTLDALGACAASEAGTDTTAPWDLLRRRRALITATLPPEQLRVVQEALGRERASRFVEDLMADIARAGLRRGIRCWVVAGGETSGAVAQALGVRLVRIGAQIDPGVPWTLSSQGLALALKSGNFGGEDFFTRSLDMLEGCGGGQSGRPSA